MQFSPPEFRGFRARPGLAPPAFRHAAALGSILLGAAVLSPLSASAQGPTSKCCDGASFETWKVGGDYANQSYSTLSKITRSSVKTLGGAWRLDVEGGDSPQFQQGNLVAAGGVIYAETTQGSTVAIDGATGAVKWRYKPSYPATLRRGVALGEGKVFTLKGGNRVVALDQATGAVVWKSSILPTAASARCPPQSPITTA